MTNKIDPMIDQDHLRAMIEVISGELELRPLLTTIVKTACQLLNADRGSIGLVDHTSQTVKIEAVFEMPDEELGSVISAGDGLAGRVYQTQAPVLIEQYGDLDSPQLQNMDDDRVVGMPIMWRGDIIGTFGIGAGPPKRFGDNDMKTLEVFARHAAIAINNARSYEREKKYAALKERQRLARDLHDNVSQLIFSQSLIAQSLRAGYEKSREEGDARVDRLLEISALAQKEMKALLAELRGPADDGDSLGAFARRNGLRAALSRHCDLATPETVSVDLDIPDDFAASDELIEALLRISQEAIANAVRHGGATQINISATPQHDAMLFCIDDNGAGIHRTIENINENTHIGLTSMAQRAAKIGGQFTVNNRASGGVRVEIRAPLS